MIGCGPKTEFGPDDTVTIHGRFLDENGNPYADKEIGIWILSLEGFSITNYWYPDPDSKDITDEDGEYEFQYKGRDLQWSSGNSKYVIIANTDMDGPVVCLGFYPIEIDEELPAVKLWDGSPKVSVADDSLATFSWDRIEETHDLPPDRYRFKAKADEEPWFELWHEDSLSTTTLTLPTFIFQNVATEWRVDAIYEAATDTGIDIIYSTRINTDPLPTQLALKSKGKPAYAQGFGNLQFSKLTNQYFHEDEAFKNQNPEWVIIDLEDTVDVSAIAIHGMVPRVPSTAVHGGFKVYLTNDTTNWGEPIGSTDKESGWFFLPDLTGSGRYLKFAKSDRSDIKIHSLKEVAVFGP